MLMRSMFYNIYILFFLLFFYFLFIFLFIIVAPCILIFTKFINQQMHIYYNSD